MAETRAYTAETNDVDRDARTVVATINTDAIDRYQTRTHLLVLRKPN